MSKKQMTLAEFVEHYTYRDAAKALGISHVSIINAISNGREITITINEDGTVTGTEAKPFPGRKPNKQKNLN